MEENPIKIKKSIDYFNTISGHSLESKRHKVGSIITFPLTGEQAIEIENSVMFSFQFDIFNTVIIRLSKGDFENYGIKEEVLQEISEEFVLKKVVGRNQDYFSLYFNGLDSFGICTLAFQKKNNQIFTVLFSTRRENEAMSMSEDFYSDNIFYIHGIWEVELSEKFNQKIFG